MKKIAITLLAAFTVSAASAQNKDDRKTAKASAVFSEIVSVQLPDATLISSCDPNKELCDTIFLLREWFDPDIKSFKVDTILHFRRKE